MGPAGVRSASSCARLRWLARRSTDGAGPTTSRPPAEGYARAGPRARRADRATIRRCTISPRARAMHGAGRHVATSERYGAVRESMRPYGKRWSVMDVGTLGKYLVAGPTRRVRRPFFPCYVRDLDPADSAMHSRSVSTATSSTTGSSPHFRRSLVRDLHVVGARPPRRCCATGSRPGASRFISSTSPRRGARSTCRPRSRELSSG